MTYDLFPIHASKINIFIKIYGLKIWANHVSVASRFFILKVKMMFRLIILKRSFLELLFIKEITMFVYTDVTEEIQIRSLTNFNQTYFRSSVIFRIFAHYF